MIFCLNHGFQELSFCYLFVTLMKENTKTSLCVNLHIFKLRAGACVFLKASVLHQLSRILIFCEKLVFFSFQPPKPTNQITLIRVTQKKENTKTFQCRRLLFFKRVGIVRITKICFFQSQSRQLPNLLKLVSTRRQQVIVSEIRRQQTINMNSFHILILMIVGENRRRIIVTFPSINQLFFIVYYRLLSSGGHQPPTSFFFESY